MGESPTSNEADAQDYYELLQISPNAEPETIHRVYRLFAQRVHPDNRDTGDEARFRLLQQAYAVLSDPEERARYDLHYHQARKDRWKVISDWNRQAEGLGVEQIVRVTVLEVLYARRRTQPGDPGVYLNELEAYTGTPREHLEFTTWYLLQKKFVERNDSSRMVITVAGVDYLEERYVDTAQRRRLPAATDPT
jgi:curved DNA-binding protein CbpA